MVLHHLKEKEKLDHSLPSSIVIGPFCVSVETVRQALSRKQSALANKVLDHFAIRLRKQDDDVSPNFWEGKIEGNRQHDNRVYLVCICSV